MQILTEEATHLITKRSVVGQHNDAKTEWEGLLTKFNHYSILFHHYMFCLVINKAEGNWFFLEKQIMIAKPVESN